MEEMKTVLIVDDTTENIDILHDILAGDYKIKAAVSGERALKIAQADPKPDMILLDIMMPEMDGYEVCRRLKADPETAEIPVIFVTAMSGEDDEAKGLALGAVDYITKPINPAITKARVKTHLQVQCLFERKQLNERKLFEVYRSQSVNDLLANIAHHWRQPLNLIVLDVENIRMDMEDSAIESESMSEMLDNIDVVVQELSKMINLFHKYQSGSQNSLSPCSPAQILDDVLLMGKNKYRLSNAKIGHSIPKELTLVTDPSILLNTFITLIGNALDMAAERKIPEPSVRIGAESDNGVCTIWVEDNAGGIAIEPIERVFDPYYTTFFKNQDKGLGLYVVRRGIEEYLGGVISVKNLSDGVRFTLRIPEHKADDDA